MLPEYPKFKLLTLEDKDLLSQNLKLKKRCISELSLANFYTWKEFENPQFTFINQDLCVLISPPNDKPYFLEPLSQNKLIETIDTCLKYAGRISRASGEFIFRIPIKNYKITPLRNEFDYIYSVKTLAELKGKIYDGKRNHIKRFQDRFPEYEFVKLDAKFKNEALELFEKWFSARKGSSYFSKLAYNVQKTALSTAFSHYGELEFLGGAILINKALKGFILGSYLNPDTVCAHFSYTDPEIPGISQILLWEACRRTFSSYTYINLEQDLGIPGIRRAKLSYHPLRLEKKFEIRLLTS